MKRKTALTAGVIIVLAAGMGIVIAKAGIRPRLEPIHAREIVRMRPGAFEPARLTVFKNSIVCFVNEDSEARWPASNIHPTHGIYPEFDPQGPVRSGEEWCFPFALAGLWRYHDHLFPELTGIVRVQE